MLQESILGTGGEWAVAVGGGGSESREDSIAESSHETPGAPTGVWSRRWMAVGDLGHTLGAGLDIKEGKESRIIPRVLCIGIKRRLGVKEPSGLRAGAGSDSNRASLFVSGCSFFFFYFFTVMSEE